MITSTISKIIIPISSTNIRPPTIPKMITTVSESNGSPGSLVPPTVVEGSVDVSSWGTTSVDISDVIRSLVVLVLFPSVMKVGVVLSVLVVAALVVSEGNMPACDCVHINTVCVCDFT